MGEPEGVPLCRARRRGIGELGDVVEVTEQFGRAQIDGVAALDQVVQGGARS